MKYKYLFGPVPSRRLGLSLGIDLIPYKTCTYDCIYCECGKTSNLTEERKEYVPTNEVIRELGQFLSRGPKLDYITFSGSGEPTLHSGIGRIINFIKLTYPRYRIAILTNGSLLYNAEIRQAIARADLIMPSLDGVTQVVFEKINRPVKLDPEIIIDGIQRLKQESKASIWVEVFIVPGINDTRDELEKIKAALIKIQPDKVQLNTLDRPGTENWIQPAAPQQLQNIASLLEPLRVEIVKFDASQPEGNIYDEDIAQSILATLARRPCTAQDLSLVLGLNLKEINKYLRILLEQEKITYREEKRGVFFMGIKNPNN